MTSGRREDDMTVTLGEVYRLVKAVKDEHGDKLDAIEAQVRIANGRTTTLEGEMKELIRARDKPPTTITTPDGESLSIRMTPKVWAALVALVTAFSVFIPYLKQWVDTLFVKGTP